MKKIIIVLSVILSMVLVGCGEKEVPTRTPDVESIVFAMDSEVLSVGTHTLVAKALPEGSVQDIKFAIQGVVNGVSISTNQLSISTSAEDEAEFTVIATSTYDPTIRATKKFKVTNLVVVEFIEVKTEEDLRSISLNEGSLNKSYKLMNHIELKNPWTPIGVADFEDDNGQTVTGTYFNGVFDGQGYTISGIDITGTLFNAGFFAQIGATGVVKNTKFQGVVDVQGWSGGVAGINLGLISNVISDMKVNVKGTSAGAIVSVNRGLIEYSYATGQTSSESNPPTAGRSSGLVAANESTMSEVYGDVDMMQTPNYAAFGPQTNPKYMLNTIEMKLASTWSKFDSNIWHIADGTYPLLKHAGFVPPVVELETNVIIKNTVLDLDLTLEASLQVEAEILNPKDTNVMKYSLVEEVMGVSIDQTGKVSFDLSKVQREFSFSVKVEIEGTEKLTTKTFNAEYNPVIESNVIEIATEADFIQYLSGQTNAENLSKTYILTSDIEFTKPVSPIGIAPNEDEGILGVGFNGVFDGQGYKLSNLHLTVGGFSKAIFAYVGQTGVIRNVHIEGGVEANGWSAGLTSTNAGLIENVILEMVVYIYGGNAGVLAVHQNGTIQNVVVISKVIAEATPDAAGLVVTQTGTMTNVLVDKELLGSKYLVSLAKVEDAEGLILKSTEALQKVETYSLFTAPVWILTEGQYPSFKIVDQNRIEISTAEQLLALLSNQKDPQMLSKTYILTADIVLTSPWQTVGIAPNEEEGVVGVAFTGTLDGQGYTISGLDMPGGGWNKAMFAYLSETAEIKNIKVSGVVEGNSWIGGLIAHNYGKLTNAIIDITVYGYAKPVGALIEHNHGIVSFVIITGKAVSDAEGATGLLVTNFGQLTHVYTTKTLLKTDTLLAHAVTVDTEGLYIISDEKMISAETYEAFDQTIWEIVEGQLPTLK